MPSSRQPESPSRRERRRRTHQRVDSNGDPAPRSRRRRHEDEDREQTSPSKRRPRERGHREHHDRRSSRQSSRPPRAECSRSASTGISSGQLAQLDQLNRKLGWEDEHGDQQKARRGQEDERRAIENERELARRERAREQDRDRRREEHNQRKRRRHEQEKAAAAAAAAASAGHPDDQSYDETEYTPQPRRRDNRVVSGHTLERGSEYYSEKEYAHDGVRLRGGANSEASDEEERQRKKKKWRKIAVGVGALLIVIAIAVPVGVVMSNRDSSTGNDDSGSSSSGSSEPSNSNLKGIDKDSIPDDAQGTYLDPFDWYDTTDFNLTYTDEKVGGLYVMGLNETWDDTNKANDKVPALDEEWKYGDMPVRGINIGGWLSIEPFITPSFFDQFSSGDEIVDEWTLCDRLGPVQARSTLEKHYSSWVTEDTFQEIQDAGFDHVRIPFSYWAITTYDGDPYVPLVSWRYLLRSIEWARKHGLRINLDLHGAPGSQNGWTHSGHQGNIGWLNGTDGDLNGQRTTDIHDQLSKFFTQERYKNIITMYGLVNEPKMTELSEDTVIQWTRDTVDTVRSNNYKGLIIIGDGFMGLPKWKGKLTDLDNIVLDAHQYVIFNTDLISKTHQDKIDFACGGWTQQSKQSMNKNTGFGPTIFGEWSQADTDCAEYLNNVGVGSRWEGTLNMVNTPGGATQGNVFEPSCPTDNSPTCSCKEANADPSDYSDEYKQFLLTFAESQMHSFEEGWGWYYWTWKTESAPQWSYKHGLDHGFMPKKTYERDWTCEGEIPSFDDLPEFY